MSSSDFFRPKGVQSPFFRPSGGFFCEVWAFFSFGLGWCLLQEGGDEVWRFYLDVSIQVKSSCFSTMGSTETTSQFKCFFIISSQRTRFIFCLSPALAGVYLVFCENHQQTWRIMAHHSRPSPIIVRIALSKCRTFASWFSHASYQAP